MKILSLVVCLMFVFSAYSAQVDTECPWMKEHNERSNPKTQKNVSKIKNKAAIKK